jgi:hypothetical protein
MLQPFLSGVVVMASFVAGLFFLRFWRESRDRLFLMFAAAFWIMAANWTALAFTDPANEARTFLYMFRLVAFSLIIFAILDKNRAAK